MLILYITLILIYIIVAAMEVNERADEEITIKDAWQSLIWPLLVIIYFIQLLMFIFNNTVPFIFTLFGLKYKKTKMYITIKNLY